MPTSQGTLDVTLKIKNHAPTPHTTTTEGWVTFDVACGLRTISITLRPRMWTKITEAAAKGGEFTIVIAGKMGEATATGFVLAEPAVQVFEKKPKEATPSGTA